jgi:DNA-binding NarL/FixJ family response regulator
VSASRGSGDNSLTAAYAEPAHVQARILIAEDDPIVREALAALIRSEPGLELVHAAADADGAIAAATAELPDVAIVDVRMPGGGALAAREIRRLSPGTSVIAFSGSNDPGTMLEMQEAGASGYLVKGSPTDTILASIEEAARSRPGSQSSSPRS